MNRQQVEFDHWTTEAARELLRFWATHAALQRTLRT